MSEPILMLEVSEVARALGLSYSGIYVLMKRWRVRPDAVTGRGLRLFLPATVEALKERYAASKAAKARPVRGKEVQP